MNECGYAIGNCVFETKHFKVSSASLYLDKFRYSPLIDVRCVGHKIENEDGFRIREDTAA